ncbi:hypothetical protein [Pseudomonas sp. RL_5y_Pfl2_73]|uniref:hypothetical protein n=1 Tax=Pseudomonas sp. RL_5y_Pfl2_73 TaxID=3088713 RepID=UPI0030DCC890
MTAPVLSLHTNEASPEYLSHLDEPYFEPDRLEGCVDEVATRLRQQQAYVKAHPPLGIYRLAAEGSQTRDGGTIQQASSPFEFKMDGRTLRAAQKGDHVAYADGSTARIVTGAGESNSDVALVDSRLSNGDEIINPPQDIAILIVRKGVSNAEVFLPAVGPAEGRRLRRNEMKENTQ